MKTKFLKGCLVLLMAILLPTVASAQKVTLSDVLKVTVRGIGPIIKGNAVQGYYMFYQLDKADKANNNYQILFLDQNLNEVAKTKFTDSKYLYLQEASFDGQFVMLKFWESKAKQVQLRKYDGTGKQVSKKLITLTNAREVYQFYTTGAAEEIQGEQLFAVDGVGFVNFTQRKTKGWGFQIDFMGIDDKTWTYNADMTLAKFQYASFLAANKDQIFVLIGEREKAMANEIDYLVLSIDIATGKKKYQTILKDAKFEIDPMNAYIDNQTGELAVMGQYYPAGDSRGGKKGRSLGLSYSRLSNAGVITQSKFNSWATEISKKVASDAKGKIEDVGFIWFHRIVQTADGKVFAIGESYRKAADGVGIAITAMGGSASLMKLIIQDMYIFEFDKDFNLNAVEVFDKTTTDVTLPQGAMYYPAPMLAPLIKAYDAFDYQFTQINPGNTVFTACYVDLEKNKGEKRQWKFGAVTYIDGKYVTDKISLETESTRLNVYAAKPGYVLITEYYKKTKTLESRLEKINY
jgi:hypothetical protein